MVDSASRRTGAGRHLAQPVQRRTRNGNGPRHQPECSATETDALANALVNLPDAVVIIDGTGTIVWGNPSAERLFERTLDQWVGNSGLELVHPADQEFAMRSLSTVQGKDVGAPIEVRIKAASGWRLIEMVGRSMQWSDDDVILLCMRDLTERRRFELASGREPRFRSLVHNAGSVIMLVSPSGVIESVSGVITRLLGHDPELLEGRPLSEIVAPPDRAELHAALGAAREAAPAGRVMRRIGLLRHDTAGAVPFELNIVNLLDDPTVEGFVVSAHDASAQVAAERDLGEALSRITATLESTADGILVVDTGGRITDFNRRFTEIWGIPDDAVARHDDVATLAFAFERLTDPNAFAAGLSGLDSTSEGQNFDLLEFRDGRIVERYARPQSVDGQLIGWVFSFRDVTDRKLLEDELSYRAFHDSLTRLANKSLFQDRLGHALDRCARTGSHLAVLFIDLDDFKTVNDSLGHGEGDQLLKGVATTLVEMLSPSDTAARLGGDEFAILVEDIPSRESVAELARRILDALRPPIRLGTKSVSAAGSIGIAFDMEDINSEQLLRNADIAMYQAKKLGKDRFEVYQDEMHALVLARLELEEELKSALRDERLVPYYQPVIDLQTSRVAGFEALVRWPQPDGTVIGPGHFVPLAQEVGLIAEIDAVVLRAACLQVRQWQELGLCGSNLEIGVNLSASQLADPELAERTATELHVCRFDPRCLVLEITESEMITDNEITMRNLAALRGLGVRIALDDFGTGYSTFSHLDRLPIDIVKIDQSFVKTLGTPDDSRSMAAAALQLAKTLGYDTIAEGVENAAQKDSLRALGCARAQGYHLGKPMGAEAAAWWLTTAPTMPETAGDAALRA